MHHLFILIPELVVRIAALCAVGMPAGVIDAALRSRILQGFCNEQRHVALCLLTEVEVPFAGIAEERDAAVGVHHAEGEGWPHTRLPPFVFAFYHQSWDAVDVAGSSPFHVGTSITAEVRARGIAVIGDNAQCSLRVPGGKVPRECGLC